MGSSPSNSIPDQVKTIHAKQKVIFDAFFRLDIVNHFNKHRIPCEIINQCFKYYEVNLLQCLPKSLENYNMKLFNNWKNSGNNIYNDHDYIDFEIALLFVNHKNESVRCRSNLTVAWILTRWQEFDQAELIII